MANHTFDFRRYNAKRPDAKRTDSADLYFVPAVAGIAVLIVLVGAVLALLMLRKRP